MKINIIIFLLIGSVFCKAQQEYPINTMPFNLPPNSYIKDFNNELNPYIGTWLSEYNGQQITLYINKVINKNFSYKDKIYFKDAIIVKYIIKNNLGNILQSTIENNDDKRNFISHTVINTASNQLGLYYTGADCGIGWGSIEIKKLNSTQISWSYYPNSTTLNNITCPNVVDTKIYLPETENLVFTKQ
ncbi:hypothetical protein EG347_09940 [Chryseobacterium sp. G0186]|uniref:DUF6705 family protein n=1 Tax=Chryseobacterium sp. G0186 TaxID=2487064 RepID=UPI000F4F3FB3|nr:DUF6705 family protein [Chryseobacterium sp. G0186]AZA77815.1 hypothetical protein EG347_09940 [Chryseobacterium sp. G0186]